MDKPKRVNSVPKGFRKIQGGLTSPPGYTWYNNGKSRFKAGYKSVLVKSRFRFNELSESAKKIATKDYQKGWRESHSEIIPLKKCRELCVDSNYDVHYSRIGKVQ